MGDVMRGGGRNGRPASRQMVGRAPAHDRGLLDSCLWLQKLVLLDLYRRFYLCLPCERQIYLGYLVIFAITYVGVQLSNVTECQPVNLYWQIVPDPGPCSQAHVQLLVLGIVNIVTDVMLMALPWPMLIKAKLQPRRKFELGLLFLFGIFIIVITAVRLPLNNNKITSQVSRSTWASVELMVAAIVVNAPTLYGLWNRRRGSGDPLVGIQQTVSVHIQEEKTFTEQQTSSDPAEELHELHRTGSPSGNKEAGLFDPSLIRLAHIAAQRKAMLYTREKLEMIGLSPIYAKFDGLIASCRGERVINLRTRHEQRPVKLLEMPIIQKRWVCKGSHRTSRFACKRLGKSVADIGCAKAVPSVHQKSPGESGYE
ncbi:hypothetical protein D0859_13267 [Hortaea werneckii]|uniref:Rhodopsin domain-containing protein n=1 Tax=Hortaea werneckii TaxID=91943 RepID=A0A3M7IBF3_HORWE|nr:hypothetical protein D0859_13267 [Hortaea werneckii]